MCFIIYQTTIYYLIIHNDLRVSLLLNNTQQCAFRRIHQATIYYLIIHSTVCLDEFIKLLFLDNSNAFSFLIIIHQALWPKG